MAQVFHACAVQGVPYDETMEIISAQGHRRWVRTHGEPVRDPSGKIVKVEGAIQDVTRHKTADAERERLQAQLAQLQKIESVGRLAGGVAHDFNNMLQVILGHADFALERLAAGESVEDDLQEIRRAATRSADLTRQLLAYARKQTIAPRILNLNETIAGMLQMLRRLIGEHIRLIWQPHVDLAPIRMDPSQLDQILANLCVNARDAITGAGTVTIRTRHAVIGPAEIARHPEQHPGDYICLSVTDDGAGM
ncbi:MAG TPA: histidine kinase dimerization/phospho-acceptor domain-containing protein, partial [Kiritimatiellia bacterium]|nr:histidine kinase dimerization/phospho-acceptor domain-containing protein [Kiritimatiellia bacterium]